MSQQKKAPTIFLNHGGGPLPLLGDPAHVNLINSWKEDSLTWKAIHNANVKAIVCVSAHHVSDTEGVVHIESDESSAPPTMLYDYYGFPKQSYSFQLKNPYHQELSTKIEQILNNNNIKTKLEKKRGRDHGCFIPLLGVKVDEKIPVVQVSICKSFDVGFHQQVGEVLGKLREEGVLILASGMVFHNFAEMNSRLEPSVKSKQFDDSLILSVKKNQLHNWETLPYARFAQPKEDHLVPLFVAVGSSQQPQNVVVETITLFGSQNSHFFFYD